MSNEHDFDDGDLTPAEKAYFESGGQNTDGLVNETPGTGAVAADDPAARSAPNPKPDAAPAAKPAAAADPAKTPAAQAQPGKQQPAAKQAATGDDDEDDPPPSGQVPYQKYQRDLKKAKERAKQTEAQLAEFREKFARGDERLRLLSEAMQPAAGQQQEADPDPEPDPNVDLFAHNQWMRRQLGRMGEALSATHQQTVETREDTALRDNYARDAMSFAREMPDFGAAYNHLLGARAAMLSEQGHDEQSIRRILHQEEKGLVQRAFQTNKRPAAMIYAMAKQMGWSPQAAPQPQPGAGGNGQAQHAAGGNGSGAGNGNGQQQPSVVAEIERIQRGQNASKSLSDGGGSPQELSVEALANMSEQDFNALYAKSAGKIDAMLGKRAH